MLSKAIKRVFRRSTDSETNPESDSDSTEENQNPENGGNTEFGIDGDSHQREENESNSTNQSPSELMDIDSFLTKLLATNSEEEEHKEVISIDVFERTSFDDKPIDQKQNILRQLLLKNDVKLGSDRNPINFLTDMEMDLLLKKFRISGLLIVAELWPQLKTKICDLIQSQPFIWFGTELSKARLLPHEDCCDLCDHILDIKECIELKENTPLAQVLNEFQSFCGVFSSLKCLRLFRFVINEETDLLLAQMCPNLLHLDLTESKITEFKEMSAQLKDLKHLILTATAINDQIFRAFVKNKKRLKTISVNYTKITGKELWRLSHGIQRIDVRGCDQLVEGYLGLFMNHKYESVRTFDQLKYLRLEVAFDDNTFAQMCITFKNLLLLELSVGIRENVRLFTEKGLKHISKLSNLRTLKLGPNIARYQLPLLDIFKGCPLMTTFSIDGSNCLVRFEDENVLTRIADFWPLLHKIEFKNVDCIEGNVLNGLTRLKYLSNLDLTECLNVEDSSLSAAIKKMSSLRYLVLDKCHRVTKDTYDAVVEKAKTMDSVLSVSFYRCNFLSIKNWPNSDRPKYYINIKDNDLPQNLRITIASVKSKRLMTFDGYRTKVFRCENFHELFTANYI